LLRGGFSEFPSPFPAEAGQCEDIYVTSEIWTPKNAKQLPVQQCLEVKAQNGAISFGDGDITSSAFSYIGRNLETKQMPRLEQ
jgi:hypothetical protein